MDNQRLVAAVLSITMPTKDRPQLLSRALASVGRAMGPDADRVELTVSDGSADEASAQAVDRFLAGWAGRHCYVHNRPPLPLVDNMNRAIELASGDWVMQLDDDDYLLPGASVAMLEAIRGARPEEAVLLFGVDIVNADGVRSRRQRFRRQQYLEPAQALERLLRNSSFVREPAVARSSYRSGTGGPVRPRVSAGLPTPTCGCGCSLATACAVSPAQPAHTPSTRRLRRPACGTRM